MIRVRWADYVIAVSRPGKEISNVNRVQPFAKSKVLWFKRLVANATTGDDSVEQLMGLKDKWSEQFFLCETPTEDVSSTEIR